jgi:hypothetical protein
MGISLRRVDSPSSNFSSSRFQYDVAKPDFCEVSSEARAMEALGKHALSVYELSGYPETFEILHRG